MALRWKKDPALTGLRRIGAPPRGATLRDGETRYATVSPYGNRITNGWYWVAGWSSGVEHKNTCQTPSPDEGTAKAEAMAYVKAELQRIAKENR